MVLVLLVAIFLGKIEEGIRGLLDVNRNSTAHIEERFFSAVPPAAVIFESHSSFYRWLIQSFPRFFPKMDYGQPKHRY